MKEKSMGFLQSWAAATLCNSLILGRKAVSLKTVTNMLDNIA